jgi:uncharacterized protein
MSGPLPERIDPLRLAESGRELRGSLPLAALQRLVPSLHATEGVVDVELSGTKEGRIRRLDGHLVTTLKMVCQRCLEPVTLPVEVRFRLGMVTSEEQAERLPEELEPLLITEPTLLLAELIEDELILALPIVALHPADSACAARVPAAVQAEPEEPDEKPRKNPFAVLSQLKNSH